MAKLRTDARYDLQAAIGHAIENVIKQNFIYQNCLNCINFKSEKEICGLCNQRPPANVICFGCPHWEDKDQIPF